MVFWKKLAAGILFFHLSCTPLYGRGTGAVYAGKVIDSTKDVISAENAVGSPDGKLARMMYLGNLDLELSDRVMNKEGDDLDVFTQRLTTEVEPGTMVYELYAKENKGDKWTYLGKGNAGGDQTNCRLTSFDLGGLNSAKHIRIVYKNPYYYTRYPKQFEDTIGVDSVMAGSERYAKD